MQALRRERQERGEHCFQVVDAAKRHKQHRARAPTIGLDGVPRLLGAEIDVSLGRGRHRSLQRALEPSLSELLTDENESLLTFPEESRVRLRQLAGLGHRAEV